MDITEILMKLKINPAAIYTEIHGGMDCSVWKIDEPYGKQFALRILPAERHAQFAKEQVSMNHALSKGVKVPAIQSVTLIGNHSVMLTDWVKGDTVFQFLLERPDTAEALGIQFGSMQKEIHSISVQGFSLENFQSWLLPASDEEKETLDQLSSVPFREKVLLHLDYHPLNVLSDGRRIAGVIDWPNASLGDFRFDLARTWSLIQFLKNRLHSDVQQTAAENFEKGWIEGYARQSQGEFSIDPLFRAWAGIRLIRDLAGSLTDKDLWMIQKWKSEAEEF
ncbi:phosphotransferase [Peribacillus sp. B-H-3]|uniref:phosphotransferase n=1 Tax=Peribacillus sp. B-H-3 TaxID=3400420 RepID=UPI003B01343D